MLFDGCFSAAGKASAEHLQTLRQSLGPGVDPAYDYTQRKSSKSSVADVKQERAAAVATNQSELDDLKQALRDIDGKDGENSDKHNTILEAWLEKQEFLNPQQAREEREKKRETSAFRVVSRATRDKLAIENRFRAPEMGTYRPNIDVGRPRSAGVISFSQPKHVAKKKDVEENPEAPEMTPEKQGTHKVCYVNIAKASGRPDFFKSMGIVSNHNTFEDGIPSAAEKTSRRTRQPCHKFSTTKTQGPKSQGTEPGKYKPNQDFVRPRSAVGGFHFEHQCSRRPASAPCGIGSRLSPASNVDRGRHIPGFDIGKFTSRPDILEKMGVKTDEDGAQEFEDVALRASMSQPALRSRPQSALTFDNSLTRQQHLRSSRCYGEDIALQRQAEAAKGPKSTELLSEIGNPALRKPEAVPDFEKYPARDPSQERKYAIKPARGKDCGVHKFERAAREGEERCDRHGFSELASGISGLRASRTYEADYASVCAAAP